jgi:hypothetical protein
VRLLNFTYKTQMKNSFWKSNSIRFLFFIPHFITCRFFFRQKNKI